jgi:glycosyltransferase involved in cell wall biosynthesis
MVQVESMLCGTPVVASDLPGVRVPVQATGMGKLAPPGDPRVLAEAILEVLEHRERFLLPRRRLNDGSCWAVR